MIWLILFIVIALFLCIIGWFISTRNNFARMIVKIKEAESGIDVALTKRYDVLTKMLEITKGYAAHEKAVISETIKLRSGATLQEKADFNSQMNEALQQINVVAEAYPELLSNQNFKELQVSVSDVEEHLQAARRAYNGNVSAFNQKRVSFPSSIVADSMSLCEEEFFQAEDYKREDVKMQF